jgi:DNA-3-methyladenine glycosylase II
MPATTLFLTPRPPFRLDLTVWTLRRRPDNVVDRWDGHVYRRVISLTGGAAAVAVTQVGSPEAPVLRVDLDGRPRCRDADAAVRASLERLLGIDRDLTGFYDAAARDEALGALAGRFRGMKPPRFTCLFEGVMNAVACQQLTLTVGIRLLNRLARAFGPAFPSRDGTAHAFPRPGDILKASPAALRELGFSRQKARAMLELAAAIEGGHLDLDAIADLPDDEAVFRLQGIRGVGRWTAEYVLLRGMGRLHVFPGDDVGARNNLQAWLRRRTPLDYAGVTRTLARWQPHTGLIYFHLLLDRLSEAGLLVGPARVAAPAAERRRNRR